MKNKGLIFHSAKMFYLNFKGYSMLAITIVLSFAILLGYMVFNDSMTYNNFKHVFASPSNALMVETQDGLKDLNSLISSCKKVDPGLKSYTYLDYSASFPQYGEMIRSKVYFIPDGGNPIIISEYISDGIGEYEYVSCYVHEVDIVKGTNRLNGNDAILSESFYNTVLKNTELPVTLIMTLKLADGSTHPVKLNVIGICKDSEFNSVKLDSSRKPIITGSIFCRQDLIKDITSDLLELPKYVAVVATDKPAEVIALAERRGFLVRSAYAAKNEAVDSIRTNINTKMWIAIILYLILGINLFGCFENALGKRSFEISVRRALGASRMQIIAQFLLEGVLVMLLSILISTTLIAELAIVFKLYLGYFKNIVWTIYITESSVWIFTVCGISMTALFSVIFAFRATNVEIVKNLKGE